VLSMTAVNDMVFTGSSDKIAKVWRFTSQSEDPSLLPKTRPSMLQCLDQFIKFKTVSADPTLRFVVLQLPPPP